MPAVVIMVEHSGECIEMKRVVHLSLCIVMLLSLFVACYKPANFSPRVTELLDLGEKYLLELDYAQALVYFSKVIEIEPMNPRGYTGAAEAYVGLGDTDNAVAILEQGLRVIPGNAVIQSMLNELQPPGSENTPAPEMSNEPTQVSQDEESEPEAWELFENPLLPNEIVFAGIQLWNCTEEAVVSFYPGGTWLDGLIYSPEYHQSESGIRFATKETGVFAQYSGYAEFRGLYIGMSYSEALNALGFSEEGASFAEGVALSRNGIDINFIISEDRCASVNTHERTDSLCSLVFWYRDFNFMHVFIGFEEDALFTIQMSTENNVQEEESSLTRENHVSLKEYSYSNLSYSYVWEPDWLGNQNAIGGCFPEFDLIGDFSDAADMLIGYGALVNNWSVESIQEQVDSITQIWKNANIIGGRGEFDGTAHVGGFPVYSDSLGTSGDVLCILLNDNCDAIGFVLIPVTLPISMNNPR